MIPISKNVDIYKINFVKNFFQYTMSAILYFTFFNEFSILKFLIGSVGFLISYRAVYYFNDIMDYEEDKKDDMRKHYKPLVTGKLKKVEMETRIFVLLIIGLPLCFFVGTIFGILVTTTLFLNFLHSSPLIRLKKTILLIPNLFVIEFIKYSLGWFALTTTLKSFPSVLIALLTVLYILGYTYYKQNVSDFFKNKKLITLSFISISLYFVSIFLYPFKLALILMFPLCFIFLVFKKYSHSLVKLKVGVNISGFILIFFMISLLLLSIPSVADLNSKFSSSVDKIKENITEIIPENIKTDMWRIERNIEIMNTDISRITEDMNSK